MRTDRLAQLERAGLVPRLTEDERQHMAAFVRALVDPQCDMLTASWLRHSINWVGGQPVANTSAHHHDFDGAAALSLGAKLKEMFGL